MRRTTADMATSFLRIERVGRGAGVVGVGLAARGVDAHVARRQQGLQRARLVERGVSGGVAGRQPGARQPVARLDVQRRGGDRLRQHGRGAGGIGGQQRCATGRDARRIRTDRHAGAPRLTPT